MAEQPWIPVAISLVAVLLSGYSALQAHWSRKAAQLTARLNETIELRRRFSMEITHVAGNTWRLRNVGTVGALDVTLTDERGRDRNFLTSDEVVNISPGSSRLFLQQPTHAGGGREIRVRWMPDLDADDPERVHREFVEATPRSAE